MKLLTGLLYLILKHFVDRYNIYFAYAPCKVEKHVHGTAVNFVIMCMFMLQANLLAYVHFHIGTAQLHEHKLEKGKNSEIRALQVFSLLGFAATAALFLGQICFNVCADFSPIHHYKSVSEADDESVEESLRDVPAAQKNAESDEVQGELIVYNQGDMPIQMRNPPMPLTAEAGTSVHPPEPEAAAASPPAHYGRYIPLLLRPEFMRHLAGAKQRLRRLSRDVPPIVDVTLDSHQSNDLDSSTIAEVGEDQRKD